MEKNMKKKHLNSINILYFIFTIAILPVMKYFPDTKFFRLDGWELETTFFNLESILGLEREIFIVSFLILLIITNIVNFTFVKLAYFFKPLVIFILVAMLLQHKQRFDITNDYAISVNSDIFLSHDIGTYLLMFITFVLFLLLIFDLINHQKHNHNLEIDSAKEL